MARAGPERPYRIDQAFSRAAFATRTGAVADFLEPYLRSGTRLLDCGCGPGSITADLAAALVPGQVVGVDVRPEAIADAVALGQERGLPNLTFQVASVYQLPFASGSFDCTFACAVLQHLRDPLTALQEIRRVLTPGGVVGIVDGSSPVVFRYPTSPLLGLWDSLLPREREYRTGRRSDPLQIRALLRQAGFARTEVTGGLGTETTGSVAGTPDAVRAVADIHLLRVRGTLGDLAVAQGWLTEHQRAQIADAILAWAESPDAIYARPGFRAIAWA